MGNCVQCGQKTRNKYPYYIAKLENSFTTLHSGITDTKKKYSFVIPVKEYACTRCINIGLCYGFAISFILVSILALTVIIFIPSFGFKPFLIGIFILINLMFIKGIISCIKSIKKDKLVRESDASFWLTQRAKILNKNPGIVYLTSEEAQNLFPNLTDKEDIIIYY